MNWVGWSIKMLSLLQSRKRGGIICRFRPESVKHLSLKVFSAKKKCQKVFKEKLKNPKAKSIPTKLPPHGSHTVMKYTHINPIKAKNSGKHRITKYSENCGSTLKTQKLRWKRVWKLMFALVKLFGTKPKHWNLKWTFDLLYKLNLKIATRIPVTRRL